jgi:hypothetical protein
MENIVTSASYIIIGRRNAKEKSKKNKSCHDTQGRAYWPKVYVMEDSDKNEQKAVQQTSSPAPSLSIKSLMAPLIYQATSLN